MAMNAARLGAAMADAAATGGTDRAASFVALAQAIIDELANHAEVTFPAGTITVPGVTAGPTTVVGAGAGGSIA